MIEHYKVGYSAESLDDLRKKYMVILQMNFLFQILLLIK